MHPFRMERVPRRQCTIAALAPKNNVVPIVQTKKKKRKKKVNNSKFLPSSTRKHFMGVIIKPSRKSNPSRASLRLYHQTKPAKKAALVKRSVKITTRTVELVNQNGPEWREPKSKLLFMVALGLTPIPNKPGVILPSIKVEIIPPDVLDELNKKYDQARAERLAIIKEERRRERLRRFERIRNWRLKQSKASAETPVEFIDLAASDEESNDEQAETLVVEPEYILPDFDFDEYPNLTIEVSSKSSVSMMDPFHRLQQQHKLHKPNFAEPIVIKRIGQGYGPGPNNNCISVGKKKLQPGGTRTFFAQQHQTR